jgi:hypothetical protein
MGLEWTLGRLPAEWIGFDWLRIGTVVSCCKCGDELSGSIATDLVN